MRRPFMRRLALDRLHEISLPRAVAQAAVKGRQQEICHVY